MKPLPYDKVKQLIPANESTPAQTAKSLQSMLAGLQFTDCSESWTDAFGAMSYVREQHSGFQLVSAPEFMAYRAALYSEKEPLWTHSTFLAQVTRSVALYFIENDAPYIAVIHSVDPEVNVLLTRAQEIRDNHIRTGKSLLSIDDSVIRRGLTYAKDMKSMAALCSPAGRELTVAEDGTSAFGNDPIVQIIARDGTLNVCEEYAHMLTRKGHDHAFVCSLTSKHLSDLCLTENSVEPRIVIIGGDTTLDNFSSVEVDHLFGAVRGRARGVKYCANNFNNFSTRYRGML